MYKIILALLLLIIAVMSFGLWEQGEVLREQDIIDLYDFPSATVPVIEEARRAYIQEVTEFWAYDTGRTVKTWWIVEAQRDVIIFDEVIKIIGGKG